MNESNNAQKIARLKNHPGIVFMGTPAFAVASLDALVKAGYHVLAVVTAPDKPAGRGMELQQSAVKQYAMKHGIEVLQPLKLKDPVFLETLKNLHAGLQVVVAFRMLPEAVWNMPPMGTINVHGSLLPQYRGAAPINWAVINGEHETGVTTFKLQHAIDTGNILMQKKMIIGEDETAGELHDRMMVLGAELLVKTVKGLLAGTLTEKPQEQLAVINSGLKHAPKIFTETCRINWQNDINDIYNLIRGLAPYPAAFTTLNGKVLKIFRCRKELSNDFVIIGNLQTDGKTFLKFACAGGYIHVKELQLEGKRRMDIESFLRGHRFN